MSVPVTPVIPKDFNPDWAAFVLKEWFVKNERDVDKIKISKVEAVLNDQQVMLAHFLYCVSVFAGFTIFSFHFYMFPIIQLQKLNPHLQRIKV